ncbi:MAG: ABC transporter substrate-binding protein [Oscillibacter sp.]|jgi:peptide/nickel transport system substrate-binding protein|nr:ABC transporter substrate-binding protein [Oscillibacter sp.]
MKSMKKVLALVLTALLALSLFGCSNAGTETPSGSGAAAGGSKTLTIGLNSEIAAMDPAFAYDNNTNAVVDQITEGLLAFDQKNQLTPCLAESWKQTDDLTYVYTIRQGVKFSDGTEMTPDDVVFSMNRVKDSTTGSYLNWMYGNVASIEKTGDWDVTVKLSQPDALWQYVPATTAGHVMSKAFCEAKGSEVGKPGTGLLGTGPYVYSDWTQGSEIVLKRNENYWNAESVNADAADTLDYKIITEGTTLVSAMQSGQVDLTMGITVDQLPTIESDKNLSVLTSDSFGVDYIAFNCSKSPMNDMNVRKAIYYAMDKDKIVNTICNKTVDPATSAIFGPAVCTFNEDEWAAYLKNLPDYKYNMDTAKEYLAKSSVPGGFDCSIICNQSAVQNSIALMLQAALKELNINLSINKVTEDERVSIFNGGNNRDYDMIFCLWFSDFPDPAGNLNSLYPSTAGGEGGSNAAVYANADVDQLLSQELASSDPDERTAIMQKILDKVTDEVPYMIMDYPKVLMITDQRVKDASFAAMYQYSLLFKEFAVKD